MLQSEVHWPWWKEQPIEKFFIPNLSVLVQGSWFLSVCICCNCVFHSDKSKQDKKTVQIKLLLLNLGRGYCFTSFTLYFWHFCKFIGFWFKFNVCGCLTMFALKKNEIIKFLNLWHKTGVETLVAITEGPQKVLNILWWKIQPSIHGF